ncbi:MAG: DUF1800 family protein [Acidobacteriaceae bacterium]
MTSLLAISKNIAGALALSLVSLALPCDAGAKTHAPTKPAPLSKRERAEHVVDRLSFGARPGDVERVEKMGVERWIAQQLHPETLDDSALDAKLNALPAMRLSTEQLIWRYPPPAMIRQVDAGSFGLSGDPVERAIYANALANYRQRKEIKAAGQTETSRAKYVTKNQPLTEKLKPINQRGKPAAFNPGRALERCAGHAAGDGAAPCAAADSGGAAAAYFRHDTAAARGAARIGRAEPRGYGGTPTGKTDSRGLQRAAA